MSELQERVAHLLTRERLVAAGDRVLLGVSGGGDSVALAHLMAALKRSRKFWVGIVHVNHRLREEAGADAACVRALGQRLGVPVTVIERDVAQEARAAGWSLEDGARRIRYRAFADAARATSATHVALAHTADDQAETVLMRLLRGAGVLGLSAIPLARPLVEDVRVIRPLLGTWRHELARYLQEQGAEYRHDRSNDDVRFVRNRIRRHLLPLLEQDYNPNVKALLVQVAEQCRTDGDYVQSAAGRSWKRLVKTREGAMAIQISGFLRQPKALQRCLVRLAIQRLQGDLTGFEFRHWQEIEQLFAERPVGAIVDLVGDVQLKREAERVIIRRCTSA